MTDLSREMASFDKALDTLLKEHEGEFALVHEEKVEVFRAEEEAISAGLKRYGADGVFLVRRIVADEQVYLPALTLGLISAPRI